MKCFGIFFMSLHCGYLLYFPLFTLFRFSFFSLSLPFFLYTIYIVNVPGGTRRDDRAESYDRDEWDELYVRDMSDESDDIGVVFLFFSLTFAAPFTFYFLYLSLIVLSITLYRILGHVRYILYIYFLFSLISYTCIHC